MVVWRVYWRAVKTAWATLRATSSTIRATASVIMQLPCPAEQQNALVGVAGDQREGQRGAAAGVPAGAFRPGPRRPGHPDRRPPAGPAPARRAAG